MVVPLMFDRTTLTDHSEDDVANHDAGARTSNSSVSVAEAGFTDHATLKGAWLSR